MTVLERECQTTIILSAKKTPCKDKWPKLMLKPVPRFPIVLSILAALATLAMKTGAYWLTGSVGLLSDAVESLVNLAAAVTAYLSLWFAARPVDASHTYGHEKIEYLSSGLEGTLILVAAGSIAWYAVQRLLVPQPLEELGIGLAIALAASGINLIVALILIKVGKAHESIVLEADGRHLLTDVWTSVGVVAALILVGLTGRHILDPLIALVVAANIVWTAWGLLSRSFNGLMDHALPADEVAALRSAIEGVLGAEQKFHALRTRRAGVRRFADFHLLVPGAWSVRRAHDLAVAVEEALRQRFPGMEVTIHVEPIEEPASWQDSELLRIEEDGNLKR
jgi:cation diffusion facilitator family transporter